ncbi:MAG: hypothetical protein KAS93_04500 [Gammaproteobacteria bacterium]|nr:hypothetical protein [Gammaproteobacteria bacterium]
MNQAILDQSGVERWIIDAAGAVANRKYVASGCFTALETGFRGQAAE